jgi:hypothetical protein
MSNRADQLAEGAVGNCPAFDQAFKKRFYFGIQLFLLLAWLRDVLHHDVRSFRPGRQVNSPRAFEENSPGRQAPLGSSRME